MKSAWTKWRSFAKKAAGIQAAVLLGLIYIVIILPAALIRRFTRKTDESKEGSSFWVDKAKAKQDLAWAKRQ